MIKKLFPFLSWAAVTRSSLRSDFLAGLTVALVLIPQSMAYAELAGLPPWIGLYASFLPVILGGLWGSSNHLQTGPVAMISLLTASVLGAFATGGTPEYGLLAAKLAFLIGVVWMIAALLRISFIINFISRPVIEGFIHAGAVIIASSQLGKILGILPEQHDHYLSGVWSMLTRLGETHWVSLGLGGGALVLLLLARRYVPKLPAALIVVMLSSAVVYLLGLSDPARVLRPLAIVGEIPPGIPHPVVAVPNGRELLDLLPGAITIAFVGFMEMSSVARALAVRSRQKLNLDQELVGQSLAAFSSAFSGGFPVSGSFSRSALNFAVNARSGLSAVFTGVFVLVFLLGFTKYLYFLPKTVLAAIIVSAVIRLMNFKKLWHFVTVNRADGLAAIVTFMATLVFAPHLEQGILIGATLSILIHLYRMMRPHVALLGVHSDGSLRDAELHGLDVDVNLPVIRFDERLVFANAAYFEEVIHKTAARFSEAKYIAIVGNGINEIDVSGAEMLKDVADQLKHNGSQLILIGVKSKVLEVMHSSGLVDLIGSENLFSGYEQAKKEIYSRLPSDMTYTI